jgi:pimeloyl-ACP methyl ester carboxylesterase
MKERISSLSLTVITALMICVNVSFTYAQVARADHLISSDPGIRIFVREVSPERAGENRPPILLLHGARVPGLASFDLAVPGGSLAADLAQAGHAVYIMDARGYGRSTRPAEMSRSPRDNPPLVRSSEVVRDVAAVVGWICSRRKVQKVALLGWATGGHWLGYYATLYPDRVSHLILLNALYGGSTGHPMLGPGSDFEDPQAPGRFNAAAFGAYRLNTVESLFSAWDRSIPLEDKSAWRDPLIAKAYAEAALASDSSAQARNPQSFRSPSGALEDSYYLASGRRLWDASLIRSPLLIIRSEKDFWSRPEDTTTLQREAVWAPYVKAVVLPEATHFVHLDRSERGRDRLIREVLDFLRAESRLRRALN